MIDDDFTQGVASNLAFELMKKTGKNFEVMGLKINLQVSQKRQIIYLQTHKEIILNVKKLLIKKTN